LLQFVNTEKGRKEKRRKKKRKCILFFKTDRHPVHRREPAATLTLVEGKKKDRKREGKEGERRKRKKSLPIPSLLTYYLLPALLLRPGHDLRLRSPPSKACSDRAEGRKKKKRKKRKETSYSSSPIIPTVCTAPSAGYPDGAHRAGKKGREEEKKEKKEY